MEEININSNTGTRRGLPAHQGDVDDRFLLRCVAGCAFLCLAAALLFDSSYTNYILGGVMMGYITLVFAYSFISCKGDISTEQILMLIFIAGFLLRLNYVLYTPLNLETHIRQHDLFDFGSGKGHTGYIEWFYNNGLKLIDQDPTTITQFYHPPLHHFIAAMWMRLLTTFGFRYERAAASIQYLTLFYSSCCMFLSARIFRMLHLKKGGLVLATAIIAFHPTFILLAGSVNNDMLSILFIFLAVYATIRWYRKPTLKNILLIAIAVGLGMMTKLSVAMVAPPIALVFLIKLIQGGRKKFKHYFRDFAIFGVVCIPLGLWYSIRNFILYDVPFGYVMQLSDTDAQYIGNYSLWQRLFDFSDHPFATVFANRVSTGSDYYEYNLFAGILKYSLFGEYNFENYAEGITPFCVALFAFNAVLIALAVCATAYFLIRRNRYLNRHMKIFLGSFYILMLVQYVVFCMAYPHTCSMDFRYITPTLLIGAFSLGAMTEESYRLAKTNETARVLSHVSVILTILFALSSAMVFLMLGA
ncbi:MAG: glycosyltransferase family 39 protein [Clostridiales bacterium]|nr:glycosyltransferase family 39 protein [Clostridiales bacterium]